MIGRLRAARSSEAGAALILALGFVVLIGAISAGLLGFITTSVSHRPILDDVRNEQYAADGAVEHEIAAARSRLDGGGAICASPATHALNGASIQVACQDVTNPVWVSGDVFLQRNAVFTASSSDGDVVVRAQVNFEQSSTGSVTATYVQSWSVNP
jgi:hypothetical protein